MVHHTKDKGDLGVAKIVADLVSRGLTILLPMTEHAPFDIVAYDGDFHRVQVKYRSARTGRILVHFRSTWADRHGTHAVAIDKAEIDVIGIYCPETDTCYYVRPQDFRASITLRVTPSANGQKSGIQSADLYPHFPLAPGASRTRRDPGDPGQHDVQADGEV